MIKGHVFQSQTFHNEAFAHFINTFLNGYSGITKGCEISHTDNSVSIFDGYFCVAGRFLQIIGNETKSDLTKSGYYSLVCEIDLDKINTEDELKQVDIKTIVSQNTYPNLIQEDLDNGGKVYQYEFARFRIIDEKIAEFIDRRTFLKISSIYAQLSEQFNSIMQEKSRNADELIENLQQELSEVEDQSIFLLKSQIQVGTDIPTTLADNTIYIQVFDE